MPRFPILADFYVWANPMWVFVYIYRVDKALSCVCLIVESGFEIRDRS